MDRFNPAFRLNQVIFVLLQSEAANPSSGSCLVPLALKSGLRILKIELSLEIIHCDPIQARNQVQSYVQIGYFPVLFLDQMGAVRLRNLATVSILTLLLHTLSSYLVRAVPAMTKRANEYREIAMFQLAKKIPQVSIPNFK